MNDLPWLRSLLLTKRVRYPGCSYGGINLNKTSQSTYKSYQQHLSTYDTIISTTPTRILNTMPRCHFLYLPRPHTITPPKLFTATANILSETHPHTVSDTPTYCYSHTHYTVTATHTYCYNHTHILSQPHQHTVKATTQQYLHTYTPTHLSHTFQS